MQHLTCPIQDLTVRISPVQPSLAQAQAQAPGLAIAQDSDSSLTFYNGNPNPSAAFQPASFPHGKQNRTRLSRFCACDFFLFRVSVCRLHGCVTRSSHLVVHLEKLASAQSNRFFCARREKRATRSQIHCIQSIVPYNRSSVLHTQYKK
jgi:hypothetical protein